MKWETIEASSTDKRWKGVLSDLNHIFYADTKELSEIYNIELAKKPQSKTRGYEYMITSWVDDKSPKNEEGKPLDIKIYINRNTNQLYWEPIVESLIRKNVLSHGVMQIKSGYIAARISPFGTFNSSTYVTSDNFPGYQMWIEYK